MTPSRALAPVDMWMNRFEAGTVRIRGVEETLWFKVHVSEEPYDSSLPLPGLAGLLQTRRGRRTYVLARPYVHDIAWEASVMLYPEPDSSGAIGHTVGHASPSGVREYEMGMAQAWYYYEDQVLLIWECILWDICGYRPPDPASDPDLKIAWLAFEKFLVNTFHPIVIATPDWDPIYGNVPDRYVRFLRDLGYEPMPGRIAVKRVS